MFLLYSTIKTILNKKDRRISFLRSIYYSLKYKNIIICSKSSRLQIDNPESLILKNGNHLNVGWRGFDSRKKTYIRLKKGSKLNLENNVSFNSGCIIFVNSNGKLTIGENTYLNEDTKLICANEIFIGSNCAIAWSVSIIDEGGHDLIVNNNVKSKNSSIKIGDHVWIGLNSTILGGANIGKNSILSANSFIKSKIPSNSLNVKNDDTLIDSDEFDWK